MRKELQKKWRFQLLSVVLCIVLLSIVPTAMAAEDPVRVLALKGPTGIGMAHMMAQNDGTYAFELAGTPDAIVSAIASGSVDIAAVPTNLAAVLYQKTGGKVKLLALNTLGVLYVLENGDTVQSIKDLSGKTLLASGQGATPEYALNYILAQNGITDVTVEYKAEHSELATLAASGKADLVLLPEPHVTSVLMKNDAFRIAINLTDAFAEAAALDGKADTVLSMGCVIVRSEFAEQYPERVAQFMTDCAASVQFVVEHVKEAAAEVEAQEIMPAAVAERAIPQCNLVFIEGETMKQQVAPLFEMFLQANPASVGGKLPDDNFYYAR